MESKKEELDDLLHKNHYIIESYFIKENLTSFFRNSFNQYSRKYFVFDMKNGFLFYKNSHKEEKFSYTISFEVLIY